MRADYLRTEKLVGFTVRNQLHETFGFSRRQGLAESTEIVLARRYIEALFFRFRFGYPRQGDLGRSEDNARDYALVAVWPETACVIRRTNALRGCGVSQHHYPVNVTDGIDTCNLRAVAVINIDEAVLIELDSDLIELETVCDRPSANRNQQDIGFYCTFANLGRHAIVVDGDFSLPRRSSALCPAFRSCVS